MNPARPMILAGLAGAVLAAAPAAAQRTVLRGQVVDAGTGQPIAAAVVELMPRHETVLTDREGKFALKAARGDHGVVADAMGYRTYVGSVSLAADTTDLRVPLPRDPVVLTGITATVSRIESRRKRVPYSVRALDVNEIASSGAPDVYTLVRERLGVMFTPCWRSPGSTCLFWRGQQIPAAVVVDEMWMPDAWVLTTYDPADIAIVESYANGRQIRVYTRWWMERAARDGRMLQPVYP